MKNAYSKKYTLKGAIVCTLALLGTMSNPLLANTGTDKCDNCSVSSPLFSPSPFHIGGFTNANSTGVPDAQLSIINAGLTGTPLATNQGSLCANLYVFNVFLKLQECCSCPVTANGLQTFSVNSNLTSNPLMGVLHTGIIEMVSSVPSTASPACDATSSYAPAGDIGAWINQVSQNWKGGFDVSESPFLATSILSKGLAKLQKSCGAITNRCTCP